MSSWLETDWEAKNRHRIKAVHDLLGLPNLITKYVYQDCWTRVRVLHRTEAMCLMNSTTAKLHIIYHWEVE